MTTMYARPPAALPIEAGVLDRDVTTTAVAAAMPGIAAPPASAPAPLLDADMFPSIVDAIISHADRATRFAFRATNREHRDRVDAVSCAHLALYAEGLVAMRTEAGETVTCVRASSAEGERVPGLKWSAFETGERERFLGLLRHARVLDVDARGGPRALAPIAPHLTNVRTVRCSPAHATPAALDFEFSTLESDLTLSCAAEMRVSHMRWRQPPIAEAALTHPRVRTWRITLRFDPAEPGLHAARIGLRAPCSLQHLKLVFSPLEPHELKRSRDEAPEPRHLGMLADAVAMAAHVIDRAYFTMAIDVAEAQSSWFAWPHDTLDADALAHAVIDAVRDATADVVGAEAVDAAMRRFTFLTKV